MAGAIAAFYTLIYFEQLLIPFIYITPAEESCAGRGKIKKL